MNDVANPIIIWGEAAFVITMIFVCFKVRYTPWPLPQFALLLTINLIANLLARGGEASWFFYTDVALFWIAPAFTLAGLQFVSENMDELTMILDTKALERKPDFISQHQGKIIWILGAGVAAIVLSNNFRHYTTATQVTGKEVAAEYRGARIATERADSAMAERDYQYRESMDSMSHRLDSLTKLSVRIATNQGKGLSNLSNLITGQQTIRSQIRKGRSPLVERPATVEAMDTLKLLDQKQIHEKSIWDKIKNLNPFKSKKTSLRSMPATDAGPSGVVGPSGPVGNAGSAGAAQTDSILVRHAVPDTTQYDSRHVADRRDPVTATETDRPELAGHVPAVRETARRGRTAADRANRHRQ